MTESFSDLRAGAYCPRQLYYQHRASETELPPIVPARRSLAFRYPALQTASDDQLQAAPIEISPQLFRERLKKASERIDRWDALVAPTARDVFVTGEETHGIVRKVLTDPLQLSVISPGRPPADGVWHSHAVQAVATARALEDDRETTITTAFVEYPAYGVLRQLAISEERRIAYRRTLAAIADTTHPPQRIDNQAKCQACPYREQCWAEKEAGQSATAD